MKIGRAIVVPHTISLWLITLAITCSPALGAVINFEDLVEGDILGAQYASHGVLFSGGTAYMAGSLLNEIDFPPHSPVMAIVDIGGPIVMDLTIGGVDRVSAYVSYLTSLTWTAYEGANVVGSATTILPELLGTSARFELSVPGRSLVCVRPTHAAPAA